MSEDLQREIAGFSDALSHFYDLLVGDHVFGVLSLLAMVGILTMNVVDWLKLLFLRSKVHRYSLENWIITSSAPYNLQSESSQLRQKLESLVAGDEISTFYSLPQSDFIFLLESGVHTYLDYPDGDANNLISVIAGDFKGGSASGETKHVSDDVSTLLDHDGEIENRLEAKSRLMRRVNSRLRVLSARISERKKAVNHIASFFVSLIIIGVSLILAKQFNFYQVLFYGVLGALVAPTAHNILETIKAAKPIK